MTTTLRARNKDFTLAGQVVYSDPIQSSQLIGINANALFP